MKKYSLLYMILLAGLFLFSCKEKQDGLDQNIEENKVRATFVRGQVSVIDTNNQKRELTLGAFISAQETIVTGSTAMAIVQLPNQAVVKILQNSQANFTKILSQNKDTEILNQGGRIFARIDKLAKDSSFKVQTVTTVAGVRGTEFLSEYINGISRIQVREGKVAVETLIDGKVVPASEKILEGGGVAEITKAEAQKSQPVKVRVQSSIEKLTINQIRSGTQPITELSSKSDAQLAEKDKKTEQEIVKAFTETQKKIDEVQLEDKPMVTLVLKDGSKMRGHIVEQDTTSIKLNVDGTVINIDKKDVIRRE